MKREPLVQRASAQPDQPAQQELQALLDRARLVQLARPEQQEPQVQQVLEPPVLLVRPEIQERQAQLVALVQQVRLALPVRPARLAQERAVELVLQVRP